MKCGKPECTDNRCRRSVNNPKSKFLKKTGEEKIDSYSSYCQPCNNPSKLPSSDSSNSNSSSDKPREVSSNSLLPKTCSDKNCKPSSCHDEDCDCDHNDLFSSRNIMIGLTGVLILFMIGYMFYIKKKSSPPPKSAGDMAEKAYTLPPAVFVEKSHP